jgi:tetratricopeptide (TPR) repeat protein/DNA-binding XRE family transcriptional regulator
MKQARNDHTRNMDSFWDTPDQRKNFFILKKIPIISRLPRYIQGTGEKRTQSMTKGTFGQLLREERKRRHWSQEDLAEKLDMDTKTISRWENGRTFPNPQDRKKLLSLLKKDLLAELNQSDLVLSPHFPTQNPYFIGREELLTQIHTTFSEGKTTIALAGLGGIGKTQIALEYAHRYQEDYHYILWATAESQDTLALDCERLATVLKLPVRQEHDPKSFINAVKTWLHDHREWLLILDNVENPDLVDEFRPRLGQGHLLITTQDAYIFEQTIQIYPMNQKESSDLLLARSGRGLEQEERAAAAELVKQMDGLPLALDQASAYIYTAQCKVTQYLQLYQTRRKELLNTRGRPAFGHSASLVATISLSLEKVQAIRGAREALEFCAFLHPEQIPEAFLRDDESSPFNSHIDGDHFLLTEALKALLQYSLVSRLIETETISMHRLVQAVLRDLMDEQKRRELAECAIHVVSHLLSEINLQTWFHYKGYLLHAQQCAIWIEDYQITSEEARDLLMITGHFLHEQAQYTEAEQFYQRASSILSPTQEPDRFKVAEQFYNDAVLYLNQGQYEQSEANLQQALALLNTLYPPEDPILVMAHNTLAELYCAQGRYKEAQELFHSVLKLREVLYEENHPLIATTCHCLAMNYLCQGEYQEAEHLFQRALKIRQQAFGEDHPDIAETLHWLAMLHLKQGLLENVPHLFEKSLTINKQVFGAQHVTVAEDLKGQALLHVDQNNYEEGEALLQQAVAIQQQLLSSDHPDTAGSLHMLGMLYADQSRYTEAEQFLQRALKLWKKSLGPLHSNIVYSLIALGQLYESQERWIEADWHFHQALQIVQKRLKTEISFQDRKIYVFLLEKIGLPDEEVW